MEKLVLCIKPNNVITVKQGLFNRKYLTLKRNFTMKNILLAFIFCLFATLLQAQDTTHYFQKTYLVDSVSMSSHAVIPIEGGYLAFGIYNIAGVDALFVMKTDLAGTYQWIKNIDEVGSNEVSVNPGTGQNLIHTTDGNVAFAYAKRVMGLNGMLTDIYLVKLRLDGSTIFNRLEMGGGIEYVYQMVETKDKGFALFGSQYCTGDTIRYYLVKTDSLGVEQWHKTYMLDGNSVGTSFQQTPDGGYILGGYGYSDTTNYDTYIIKTDSLGIVQWSNNFGGLYNEYSGRVNLLANGQYLVTGLDYPNGFQYLRLSKLDSNGIMIWYSLYTTVPSYQNPTTPVIFLADSTFVTILFYHTVSTGRVSNLLACFDLSGNILWDREFSSNLNENSRLRDLRRTTDGGFIMAGYEHTFAPQKGYLVKVDSLGRSCSVLGCDSVAYSFPDVVPPPPNIANNWQVYPNPAQDYLTISNLSTQQNATFVLYDVLGREQLRQNLSYPSFGGGKGEATIATKHLPSGMYIYQIINPKKQTLQYGKVSIVR